MSDAVLPKRDVYFRFTNRCDLACDHCFYEPARPRTMSHEELKKAFTNIRAAETLYVTGGEPFTQPDRLLTLLETARELLPESRIIVQTNGTWIKTAEQVAGVYRELHRRGADGMDWMGNDGYHAAKGLDIDWLCADDGPLRTAQQLFRETDGIEFPIIMHGCIGKPIAVGKAKRLPRQECSDRSRCCAFSSEDGTPMVTVSPEGGVYPCPTQVTPPIGSIFDEPLDKMLERATTLPWLTTLLREGPAGIAYQRGIIDSSDKKAFGKNACVACDILFNAPTARKERVRSIDYFGGA